MQRLLPALLAASLLCTAAANAAETSLQTVIGFTGDVQQQTIRYECDKSGETRHVRYVNASPNFLAITTIDDAELIMVTTLSASGARYMAGHYVWWTKGAEATLYDLLDGPDADPMDTCIEANDIP